MAGIAIAEQSAEMTRLLRDMVADVPLARIVFAGLPMIVIDGVEQEASNLIVSATGIISFWAYPKGRRMALENELKISSIANTSVVDGVWVALETGSD